MNAASLRKNNRRENSRRVNERRIIPYEFGSEEWLKMIKELYFMWPKENQRVKARRESERREEDRRKSDTGRGSLFKQVEKTVAELTDEEIKVLNGLWTN